MLSYWERQSFLHYHHIVIGAGLIGLSAAIELKEAFPTQRVLVLERGMLPTGASTRNAGFACMGSATELLDDLQTTAEAEVINLFDLRRRGLLRLRERLGDAAIGYRADGSHDLLQEHELSALEKLDYLNQLIYPLLGQNAFEVASDSIPTFGLNSNTAKALIRNTCEGSLNSGMMMRALTDMAIEKGVEIKTGAAILSHHEEGKHVTVTIADAIRNQELHLQCDTLSICTNAFTKALLPDVDVTPGRGQVLITKPIEGLKLKGVFHFDRGYYYFRELHGRVLLGGGRNLDFAGETTTNFNLNTLIQQDLEEKLRTLILPNTPFEIDMRWTGIMAFGQTKQPIIQSFNNRVFGAFRMGGMGVAIGSEAAAQMVALIKKQLG